MTLKIFNTLTKKKEEFKPIKEGEVKLYLCGPTVYDLLHIGNFRGAIFFNLVRNWLEHIGNKVTFVYNYTDVDDKIINKANSEGVDPTDISERFIKEFEKDFTALKLKPHDHNPKVTQFIPEIVSFVEDLVKKEVAYVVEGEVFYSIDSFPEYGKLSGKNLDDLEAGSRIEIDGRKKNPFDFVLWKPSKEGEPSWSSPWGEGRPGWHIECSAMIHSILGESIDIHGGGIDLIHPHHENEIAQGEGRTDKQYCKYWMHNNFINLKDQKMSKSLGNVISARSFMEKYHPEIMKFVMLSVHYRSLLNVNEEKLSGAFSGLSRIYSALLLASGYTEKSDGKGNIDLSFLKLTKEHDDKILQSLNDDFNTGELIASIFEVLRSYNNFIKGKKKKNAVAQATSDHFIKWVKGYGEMMALFTEEPFALLKALDTILLSDKEIDPASVEGLIEQRKQARAAQDWTRADEIRDQLDTLGIELQDGNEHFPWTVKK